MTRTTLTSLAVDGEPPGVQPPVRAAADVTDDSDEGADGTPHATAAQTPATKRRGHSWRGAVAYGLLPALAASLTVTAAYFKWEVMQNQMADRAAAESVAAAESTAIAMLSYRFDSVERDLGAALDRMTEDFRQSYLQLTHDVVVPGAKQRQLSTEAVVKAAAPVEAELDRATVMLFIDQTVVMGQDAPVVSASSVRVTLDKVDDRWLVAAFDPV